MVKTFSYKKIRKIFLAVVLLTPFFFAHHVDAAVLSPGIITTCGELATGGTYVLGNNISSSIVTATGNGGTCFTVTSDNVTIDGGGHTATGTNANIAVFAKNTGEWGDGLTGAQNLLVENITFASFTGGVDISGYGYNGSDVNTVTATQYGNGGWGGLVTVSNSVMGIIYANGGGSADDGSGQFGAGGNGGSVSLTNSSTVTSIQADGVSGDPNIFYPGQIGGSGGGITVDHSTVTGSMSVAGSYGTGTAGSGGSVSVYNSSVVGNVDTSGSDTNEGSGGGGGSITIENSTAGILTGNGGGVVNGAGPGAGGGASISISTSTVTSITANGGNGWDNASGSGGNVQITNSTVGAITINGGVGAGAGSGSDGGILTVLRSHITGIINANGSTGNGGNGSGFGGNGGSVTFINSSSTSAVNLYGGYGTDNNGGNGGTASTSNSTIAGNINAIGGMTAGGSNSGTGGTITLLNSTALNLNTSSSATTTQNSCNTSGAAGNISVTDSHFGNLISNGGSTCDTPSDGGNITIVSSSTLNISNINISAIGGTTANQSLSPNEAGYYGNPGTLHITYTGSLVDTGTTHSNFSSVSINGHPIGALNSNVALSSILLPGTIATCGSIYIPGTYTLGGNIGSGGTCLTIATSTVTIAGAGHTITGDVVGSGVSAAAELDNSGIAASDGDHGPNFSIQNTTITGAVSSSGGRGGDDSSIGGNRGGSGGNGGTITLATSTIGSVSSNGGGGGDDYNGALPGNGGDGGTIVINNSAVSVSGTITADGGGRGTNIAYPGNNEGNYGSPGTVSVNYTGTLDAYNGFNLGSLSDVSATKNATTIHSGSYNGGPILFPATTTIAGNAAFAGTYALGGNITGVIQVVHSGVTINGAGHTVTGSVSGNGAGGGDEVDDGNGNLVTNAGGGQNGFSFTVQNVIADSVTSTGGNGGADQVTQTQGAPGNGGDGGVVSIASSTIGDINTSGGVGGTDNNGTNPGNGGNAGAVTLTNSSFTGTLNVNGGGSGVSPYGASGNPNAGSAASITLINSTFSGGNINAYGGYAVGSAAGPFGAGNGGNGGAILISASSSLDISNSTINVNAGGSDPGGNGGSAGSLHIITTGTFTHTNFNLNALSPLIISQNGTSTNYGGWPGGILLLPGIINESGVINYAGTYTLGSDLGSDLRVTGGNPTIDGAGHTITGSINGSGIDGGNEQPDGFGGFVGGTQPIGGAGFTIQNATVTADLSANGGGGSSGAGSGDAASGGSITVINSTIGGQIYTPGGTAVGYYNGYGGSGGNITLTNSTVQGILTTSGGVGHDDQFGGSTGPGSAGNVTITNSTIHSNVVATGGAGSPNAVGGNGGNLTITSSSTINIAGLNFNVSGGADNGSGPGIDGVITLNYAGLTTDGSTHFSNASDLVTNGHHNGAFTDGTFNPQIFYFNDSSGVGGGADGDWGNTNNWFTDAGFTTHANALPQAFSQVIVGFNVSKDTTGSATADTVTFTGSAINNINITVANGAFFTGSSSNGPKGNIRGISTYVGDQASNNRTASTTVVSTWVRHNGYQSNGGATYSQSITSSADGTKLALTTLNNNSDPSYIYTSTDSGVTWTEQQGSEATTDGWYRITSSADGTKLAAIRYGISYNIYTSTDSGVNWTPRINSGLRSWVAITSSADGTKLAAAEYYNGGNIYLSSNSGSTWATSTGSLSMGGNKDWTSMTSSASGTKLAIVDYSGDLFTSTDSGVNWTQRSYGATGQNLTITSSADGTKLALVDGSGSGYIYTSTDSGVNWTAQTSLGQKYWYPTITSSADGSKLAVVSTDGVYISTDYGVNWTAQNIADTGGTYSIVSSADGSKLAFVGYNSGYVYTYGTTTLSDSAYTPIRQFSSSATTLRNFLTEGGHNNWVIEALSGAVVNLANATYSLVTNVFHAFANAIFVTNPSINGGAAVVPQVVVTSPASGTIIKWNPSITWGNATSCMYKLDGGNYTSLTCANHGSDIPRPTALTSHTLYVKGTDNLGNLSEKILTFTYDNTQPVDTDCSTSLDESRPYYLTGTTTATCNITANNVTLDGHGFTLNGGITGNATSSTGNGLSFTVASTTVTGAITSNGGSAGGRTGGTIILKNATTTNVTANGGTNGGAGGTITVGTSTTAALTANGASNAAGAGGHGGTVNLNNSQGAASSTPISVVGGNSTNCSAGGTGGTVNFISYSSNYTYNVSGGTSSGCSGGGPGQTGGSGPIPTPPPAPGSGGSGSSGSGGTGGGGTSSGGGATGGGSSGPVYNNSDGTIPTVTLPVTPFTPLHLTDLPTFGGTGSSSFSFNDPISSFLYSPLPEPLASALLKDPSLAAFLTKLGITYAQDLVDLSKNAISFPPFKNTQPPVGLFQVSASGTPMLSYMDYDVKYHLVQLIRVAPGTKLNVGVIPLDTASTSAQFQGQTYKFSPAQFPQFASEYDLAVTAPSVNGRYYLTNETSPLVLAIDVTPVSKNSSAIGSFGSGVWNAIANAFMTLLSWFMAILHFFTHLFKW